jgi:peroxiredoxin
LSTRTLLFCLISSLLLLAASAAPSARPTSGLTIGQPAPGFTLTDINGQTHALKDYRGRIVLIGFISTQCPISNAYNERMRAIAAEYGARGVTFLGINANSNEPGSEIREHAARHQLRFTILKDEGNKVADAYGAERTPEMYLIDGAGVLRYHGRIDNAIELPRVKRRDLREALDELLAGQPVSVPEAKAFGCLIKRAEEAEAQASAQAPAPAPSPAPQVARLKPAEFAKLKQQTQGRVLVLNFWATWCGPCIAEFPEFVAIDEKYRAQGVRLVAISADEVSDIKTKVIPFIKEMKARFEIFVQDTDDPQEMIDVVDKEWLGALPATFVFDRAGKRIFTRYGIIDREQLVAAIEGALK